MIDFTEKEEKQLTALVLPIVRTARDAQGDPSVQCSHATVAIVNLMKKLRMLGQRKVLDEQIADIDTWMSWQDDPGVWDKLAERREQLQSLVDEIDDEADTRVPA